MRTKSYEQLERSYNRIDERHGNGSKPLFDRVLNGYLGSCAPRETVREYYFALNRDGRRRILGELAEFLTEQQFMKVLRYLEII